MNSRYGTQWLILLGAALCGISAGVFWMAEAAIAIAYPEPWNKGKALGYWLTYRLSGQILGGAVNIGLNVNENKAGQVSYTVYILFIAIQAAGPLVALLLNKPNQVQRKDGRQVELSILQNPWYEIKKTSKLFLTKRFLLIVPLIGQAVFSEAVFFTYLSRTCPPLGGASHGVRKQRILVLMLITSSWMQPTVWFSVRARALGSFLGGIVAVIGGNILGVSDPLHNNLMMIIIIIISLFVRLLIVVLCMQYYIDRTQIALKVRARYGFIVILTLSGAFWTWATIIVTEYTRTQPTLDWNDAGFGRGFGVFLFLTLGFQLNYLFLYFVVQNLADDDESMVIRYSALLRGTESAWQALSYGLESLTVFGQHGGVYMNFALWAVALAPAWLVIREFGTRKESSLEGGSSSTAGAESAEYREEGDSKSK